MHFTKSMLLNHSMQTRQFSYYFYCCVSNTFKDIHKIITIIRPLSSTQKYLRLCWIPSAASSVFSSARNFPHCYGSLWPIIFLRVRLPFYHIYKKLEQVRALRDLSQFLFSNLLRLCALFANSVLQLR